MTFDYNKLRGKIREKYGAESKFAEAMDMSSPTMSAKLNGKVCWTDKDIIKACELLDIPFEFIPVYFFTEEVKKS